MAIQLNKEALDIATMSAVSDDASPPSNEKVHGGISNDRDVTEITKDWSDEEERNVRWKYAEPHSSFSISNS